MRLRAIELKAVDVPKSAEFLERTWGVFKVDSGGSTRYFRGTADHPYILSLTPASAPGVEAITFSCNTAEIEAMRERVRHQNIAQLDAPGGGSGILVEGPEGQRYRFVTEVKVKSLPVERDRPIELSHAVINVADRQKSERFAIESLGFKLSDRTAFMSFLRCNRKHHALAYAQSEVSSLNHIAFEMRDIDAVMNGIGRMREAGYACCWGPGRHGPGNNVFGYFVSPFGPVIEYTAEVGEVDENYRVGGPEDWKWPPGRTDHWGISPRDTPRMHAAEHAMRWS